LHEVGGRRLIMQREKEKSICIRHSAEMTVLAPQRFWSRGSVLHVCVLFLLVSSTVWRGEGFCL